MQQSFKINTNENDGPNFAAQIVNKAYPYSSTIQIKSGNKTVSAKSLVGLTSLMLHNGEYITLYINGPDETAAAHAIASYLSSEEY